MTALPASPQLVIFDYDGVLADTLRLCLEAAERAAATLGRDIRLEPQVWTQLGQVTFDDLAVHLGFRGQEIEAFSRYIFNYTQAPPQWPRLFPGISHSLKQLSEHIPLQVLSASSSAAINNVLREAELRDFISAVCGGDQPGSKTEKLDQILSSAQIPADAALMVGDSVSDIQAARACGVPAVAVSWGWLPEDRLRAEQPEFFIHNPGQLLELCRIPEPEPAQQPPPIAAKR